MSEENVSERSQDLGDLEAEKLRYEIRQLSQPFWKRPSVLAGVIMPLVGVFLTVGAGVLTGFFDQELTNRRQEKETLLIMNQSLSLSVDLLNSQTGLLESQKASLEETSIELKTENESLSHSLVSLDEETRLLKSQKALLEEEANSLRLMSTKVVQVLEESSRSLTDMVAEKGDLWNEVLDSNLTEERKLEFQARLRRLLASIRATESQLQEARGYLNSMQQ